MTGVVVDTEGATYIPTFSPSAVRPWIATARFGPYHLTCGTSSLPGACSLVGAVMT